MCVLALSPPTATTHIASASGFFFAGLIVGIVIGVLVVIVIIIVAVVMVMRGSNDGNPDAGKVTFAAGAGAASFENPLYDIGPSGPEVINEGAYDTVDAGGHEAGYM